jgi:hypothetical protein
MFIHDIKYLYIRLIIEPLMCVLTGNRSGTVPASRTYLLVFPYLALVRSIVMIFHIDQVRSETGAGRLRLAFFMFVSWGLNPGYNLKK